MAIILPQRWTRQPQNRVNLDPKWVAAGLNLALIPQGNGLVDCSNKNRQGSGGVRSQTTAPQGKMVSRTSGAYVFRGLSQSTTRFSLIALVRVTNIANENVISLSCTGTTDFAIQFCIFQSQIELICGNTAIVAASTNSGLANNRTFVVGLTHDGSGAGSTIFYIDGKQLNTVSGTQSFVADGSGTMFVKHDGSTNPLVGSLGLHLDFNTVLKPEQMIALTGNPWQVFAPTRWLYLEETAASGVTGTSATTNANDTSAASGTSTVTGTLARTNANDTSAATGTTTVTGSLATTNADDTSAASGAVGQTTGTVDYTNNNDTSSAAGTTTVLGVLARTNADDTSVAAGTTTIIGTSATTNENDTCTASGTSGNTPPPTPVVQAMGGLSSSRHKRYYIERDGKRIFFTDAREVAHLLKREEQKVVNKAKQAIKRVRKSDIAELITFGEINIPKPKIVMKFNDEAMNKEVGRINERIQASFLKALMNHIETLEEDEAFLELLFQ
jgi:hypothetical protein